MSASRTIRKQRARIDVLEKATALQADTRSQEKYLALLGAMTDYEAEFGSPADAIAKAMHGTPGAYHAQSFEETFGADPIGKDGESGDGAHGYDITARNRKRLEERKR